MTKDDYEAVVEDVFGRTRGVIKDDGAALPEQRDIGLLGEEKVYQARRFLELEAGLTDTDLYRNTDDEAKRVEWEVRAKHARIALDLLNGTKLFLGLADQ